MTETTQLVASGNLLSNFMAKPKKWHMALKAQMANQNWQNTHTVSPAKTLKNQLISNPAIVLRYQI